MHEDVRPTPPPNRKDRDDEPATRMPWRPPTIEKLPPLTDLTLQTGSPIPGGEGLFS
jgi:hypothetical protein